MTDSHSITLSPGADNSYSVTEDTVVNKEEDGTPGGVPDGFNPYKSSSDETSPSASGGG